ncbi:hypothetical protein BC826DRAFT_1036623 [Russula brevipes]|nr:hypothetical protein BC826DRAFT_1036623 [Russula brevipes]
MGHVARDERSRRCERHYSASNKSKTCPLQENSSISDIAPFSKVLRARAPDQGNLPPPQCPLSHSLYCSTSTSASCIPQLGISPLLRSISETSPTRPFALGPDHVVIVPGHGIWTGAHPEDAKVEASKIRGYSTCFIPEGTPASIHFPRTHIPTQGSQIAIKNSQAFLVFGGDHTSPFSTTSKGELIVLAFRARDGAFSRLRIHASDHY